MAVIAYSPLAHGNLTGKFGRKPVLAPGDQRHTILPFRADIWPHVFAGVEKLKKPRRRNWAAACNARHPLDPRSSRHQFGRRRRPEQRTIFGKRCRSGADGSGQRLSGDDGHQR